MGQQYFSGYEDRNEGSYQPMTGKERADCAPEARAARVAAYEAEQFWAAVAAVKRGDCSVRDARSYFDFSAVDAFEAVCASK